MNRIPTWCETQHHVVLAVNQDRYGVERKFLKQWTDQNLNSPLLFL